MPSAVHVEGQPTEQSGKLLDVLRLGNFATSLYKLLDSTGEPISPLITQTIDRAPALPNGWLAFDSYFRIVDRCGNQLQVSVHEVDAASGALS
jgi:hypothetical protein